MRALLIIAALAGCTTLHTEQSEREIRLTGSAGAADIRAAGLEYNALLATGKRVIWDGPMVSADAFYAPAAVVASGGCYTRNATWHPHAASAFGLFPHRGATEFLTEEVLPEPFRSLFRESWHYYDHLTLAIYTNADLRAIWPEYACKERT